MMFVLGFNQVISVRLGSTECNDGLGLSSTSGSGFISQRNDDENRKFMKAFTLHVKRQRSVLCMTSSNMLDPKLGTRLQVQPRIVHHVPKVGEHPCREKIRELKEIPEERFAFKDWFTQVMSFMAMKEYNPMASNLILRVLLLFASKSDMHRRYMSEFIRQSSFCEIWQARMPKVFRGRIRHKEIGGVIRSAGLLKMRLSDSFLEQWYEAALNFKDRKRMKWNPDLFEKYRGLPGLQHLQIAGIMRGFGELNIRPPNYFMEQWFEAFLREQSFMLAPTLSDCIWGLSVLGIQPDYYFVEAWCNRFEKSTEKGIFVAKIDRYNLGISMYGFAKLGIRPPQSTIDAWFKAMTDVLNTRRRYTPESFVEATSDSFWALGKLKIPLSQSFLNAYFQRFTSERKNLRPAHLTDVIWAYGRLLPKVTPEFTEHVAMWCAAFRREDFFMRNFFTHEQLAKMAWAFGRLQICMDEETLNCWYEAFEREQDEFTSTELSNILWMFGKVRLQPDSGFFRVWEEQFMKRNPTEWSCSTLANVVYAFGRLRKKPSPEFLAEWYARFSAAQSGTTPDVVLAKVKWSFDQLKISPRISFGNLEQGAKKDEQSQNVVVREVTSFGVQSPR